jgi:hypothetical protein
MVELTPSLRVDTGVDAHSKVVVTARFSRDVDLDDPRFGLATTTLEQVAQRGGFAVDDGTCALSFLRFDAVAARTVQWAMQLHNCDPRVFEIFREVFARERTGALLCRAIDVIRMNNEYPDRRLTEWPTEITDHIAYPGLTSAAAGLYAGGSDNLSKSRRVLVEQRQSASAARVTEVATWIEPWARLLEGGGYAMPVGHPSATESVFGCVSQYSERELEIAVDRFMASESAWNVLANMLYAVSTVEQTIVRIELD